VPVAILLSDWVNSGSFPTREQKAFIERRDADERP
jgi:hypothetical protein